MENNVWFPFANLNSNNLGVKQKVFCFHHAGGSAAIYRSWIMYGNDIDIYPVELPGKGTRMKEEYITNYENLVPKIAEAINNVTNGEHFSLFGHSMGAIMAFKTAFLLETKHNNKADKLIVAGRHAPIDNILDRYQTWMNDKELIKEIKRVNGTPKEILESEEILKILLPAIKNDYKLNESFDYKDEVISSSIIAHFGSEDLDAQKEQMERWKMVTTREFELKEFNGNHFFLYDLGEKYYNEVVKEILK
ncbi:thioesterase II family protein [Clostridium sp. LCP25S3_F10]|uniref:thioesterase II family protein n=1 Tax=Clostridium sp. LCP25S3_F10 TaxID=3438750 RepID=UPI003F916D7B